MSLCISKRVIWLSRYMWETFPSETAEKKIICLESSFTVKALGLWWTTSWPRAHDVSLQQRRLKVFRAAIGTLLSRGWRILPIYSALLWPSLEWCAHFWASRYKREMELLEWDSKEVRQPWRHLRYSRIFDTRRPWESRDCLAWRREGSRGFSSMCKHSTKWDEYKGVRRVPSDRRRDNAVLWGTGMTSAGLLCVAFRGENFKFRWMLKTKLLE